MSEQLKMFSGGKLVIEWNEDAAREKNRVCGYQPLGLIRHDNCGAVSRGKPGILEGSRQRVGGFAELPVRVRREFSRSRSASIKHTSSGQRSRAARRAAPNDSNVESNPAFGFATRAQRHQRTKRLYGEFIGWIALFVFRFARLCGRRSANRLET